MFPIEIKLKKRFYIKDSLLEKNIDILEFFKQEFINRKANNVRIENNEVRFNNNFFRLIDNWNIMFPIDKGILAIKNDKKSEIEIEYIFSLKVILIISGIFGIIVAIFSRIWTDGVFAFLWLSGLNWLFAVIRHSIFFGRLNNELKAKVLK